MRFKRKKQRPEAAIWLVVAGVVLTGAAAYAVTRLLRSGPVRRRLDLRSLEKQVIQALLSDETARTQGIDIAAVGEGIVELSGTVDTQENARHVVGLVDRIPGVHAVLNRLEINAVESQLQRNRTKTAGSATRWYGGSVGMGRQRQGTSSDPDRYDDRAEMLTRSLQPNLDETLADVEESEHNGVSIGIANKAAFSSHVAPHSPSPETDRPAPPPAVAPHDKAQRK